MHCLWRMLPVALIATACHFLAGTAVAEETNLVPTRINAERMEFDYEDGVIYLRGRVVVRDEQGTLAADNATVYLESKGSKEEGPENMIGRDVGGFTRVVAVGNVKMTVENRVAVSNKAVWNREEQTIVLTGGPPLLQQDASFIRATRIVFHTDTQKCDFYPNPEVVFQVSDEDRERFAQ
jgi:lipopolysaccharide transport protein LptA